ncbi:MAG: type II toxin-antitoxin system RelE/ParE family toxin [Legionellales bacterium]|nr:type II toxin-antitoxin system RelE/ParE family toxin [Legionellales bacterium]
MKIRWLEDSIQDLISLRQYIEQENPAAAKRVAKIIIQSVNLLLDQPGIGRAGRVPNSRELVVTGTPFLVPYRIKNNTIEILRVLHSARQWPEAF